MKKYVDNQTLFE